MICDTHLHVYDSRYPTAAEAVVLADDASPDDYRSVQAALGVERLVVVQPSAYGLDNSCQIDAMAQFASHRTLHHGTQNDGMTYHGMTNHGTNVSGTGDGGAGSDGAANDTVRGVMVVDATVADTELRRLTDLGVRGARFHMLSGGAVPWEQLEPVAAKIAPFGWHIQLQLNGRELAARQARLAALPTDVVIDHIGRFMPPVPIDDANFRALVSLLENGRTWVKLSAPYESSVEPITDEPGDHTDVDPLISDLVDRVPERLLWATNWPHPGQETAPTPATLRAQRERWLPTDELRRQVLVTNPDRLYFT